MCSFISDFIIDLSVLLKTFLRKSGSPLGILTAFLQSFTMNVGHLIHIIGTFAFLPSNQTEQAYICILK